VLVIIVNMFYKRVRITSECAPHQLSTTRKLLTIIVPPTQAQPASYEANIGLAILSLQQNQFQSKTVATRTFNISRDTLHRQRASKPAQGDCQPNSKKLTQLEEEVIVSYILNLNQRRFSPTYEAVRDIANKLLAARGAGQVSVH
jgi:hypothetical protein